MLPSSPGKLNTKKHRNVIESFGLILFYVEMDIDLSAKKVYYLIQERRDTFEYVEKIQGLYASEERHRAIFSMMTKEERERILSHSFDELWDDLLLDKNMRIYKEGYGKAKKRFEESEYKLKDYITKSNTEIETPPWGFPKGRKNSLSEREQECAIRESEEECRVPRDLYRILPHKYSEKFVGSNGVSYSTTYFLCEVKEKYTPVKIDTNSTIRKTTISEEVSNVGWFTYEDAYNILNPQRRLILYEAHEAVKRQFGIAI